MRRWQEQHAKARFGELLEATLKDGPQVVTRRGVEVAVVVPITEWQRRLRQVGPPTLKELLLADEARFEPIVPPRRRWRRRPALG